MSSTWVEIVGRAGLGGPPAEIVSGASSATYPPRMSELRITVGDLHFSAHWEPAAPQTIAAIRRVNAAAD